MYKVLEIEDEVRVPANKMALELDAAIEASIQHQYEGAMNAELGIVLAVEDVADVGDGRMEPGDGAVYYPAKFRLLTYVPQEHEVVIGEVIDITEFGAFVRIGPLDGLIHISQVMNDYVSLDKKNGVLAGKESRRILKKGDVVRARIISVSYGKEAKIGLTMRQPHLGAIHWLEGVRERKEPKAKEVIKEGKAEEMKTEAIEKKETKEANVEKKEESKEETKKEEKKGA